MNSHEFRTPLMTIQTSTEFLNHYRSRLSPEKQSIHLQRIQSAVARMTQMLNSEVGQGTTFTVKLPYHQG
jgi:signal transduction histidine kinase